MRNLLSDKIEEANRNKNASRIISIARGYDRWRDKDKSAIRIAIHAALATQGVPFGSDAAAFVIEEVILGAVETLELRG